MKKILSLLMIALITGFVAFMSSCKDDDDPELTDQQKAARTLSEDAWGGSGKVEVTPPRAEVTPDLYEPLTTLQLEFGATTDYEPTSFEATGGGDFFPDVNTTWSWSGAGTSTIQIASGQVTQLTGLTFDPDVENATSITFTFNYPASGGKVKDVTGDYTVTLSK